MSEHESKKGELGIGAIFLLLVLGVFILWVLTGGPDKSKNAKPYETPTYPSVDEVVPSYGVTNNN